MKFEFYFQGGACFCNPLYSSMTQNKFIFSSSRGSSQSLEQLADSCYRSLQQMDPDLLGELKSKVSVAIESSHNSQMKEIRGLGSCKCENSLS